MKKGAKTPLAVEFIATIFVAVLMVLVLNDKFHWFDQADEGVSAPSTRAALADE